MTRTLVILAALAVGAAAALPAGDRAPAGPSITVYKTPTCSCCKKWVEHLQKAGFEVAVHDLEDLSEIKTEAGVPTALKSCHTALVQGYTVEGHVPADLIQQMLREKPKVHGLAVPGMPMGSPGMEGDRKDAYEVLTFTRDGKTQVYAKR